jgi:hypothetical protein
MLAVGVAIKATWGLVLIAMLAQIVPLIVFLS